MRPNPGVVAVGIFILALSVRLLFQAGFAGWDSAPRYDAAQYDAIAWSLSQGGPYLGPDGYVSHRAPAYPFLLAGVYTIFGRSWTAARIAQGLLGAATSVVLLFLAPEWIPTRVRVLTALVYAVFPYSVYWSGYLWSEPLCVLLVALWTYSLFKSRASPGWLGVWAFVCGLTALTRPNMGLLFIFGLLWVRARSGPWLGRCLMATTIFLLTLLPWTIRNYSIHHRLVPVTTMGGVVLWESNNPHIMTNEDMLGRSSHAADLPEARALHLLPEAEEDEAYFRLAAGFIGTHWRAMPKLLVYKMARMWNPFPTLESRMQSMGAALSIIPMFLLFGAGLWLAWSRRETWLVPILIPVAVVTLTALIYWGDARIRSPAEPSIILVAAHSLVFGWDRFRGFFSDRSRSIGSIPNHPLNRKQ